MDVTYHSMAYNGRMLNTPPHELLAVTDPGGGNPPMKFLNRTENCTLPLQRLWKNIALAFFSGHLITNPILSALHLQGVKSNIYVQFQLVNKQLIGISFQSETINEARN